MLEYDWGNPSSILLSSGELEETERPSNQQHQHPDQNPHIFDHYTHNNLPAAEGPFITSSSTSTPLQTATNYNSSTLVVTDHNYPFQHQHQIIYDPAPTYNNNTDNNLSNYPSPAFSPQESIAAAVGAGGGGASSSHYMLSPKHQNFCTQQQRAPLFDFSAPTTARIGLNLGGRTYFSSEDDFVNRLYRRSRHMEFGPINVPKCQAEGCNADLTHSKHYHRRHKVCEFHSKASTVQTAGLTQRFCQQCSRFHLLTEFDQGKRSCRKRLADHNRRRRKSNLPTPLVASPRQLNKVVDQNHPSRSSPDSGGGIMRSSSSPSTSTVTMAVSHLDQCCLVMRT